MWPCVVGWMGPSSAGPSRLGLLGQLGPPENRPPTRRHVPDRLCSKCMSSVCHLLRSGVAAIFGPQSGQTASHVQSICDTMEIPHLETRWDYRLRRESCLVNLYPHPTTLSKVSSMMETHTVEHTRDSLPVDTADWQSVCVAGVRGSGACLGLALLHHHLWEQWGAGAPAGAPESARTVRVPYSCSAAWRGHGLQVGTLSVTAGT